MKNQWFLIVGIIILFFSAVIFYSEAKGFAGLIVSSYGLIGIFLIAIIMDTLIQPISPDILVFGAAFGGADVILAAFVGGIGSCIGGTLGFYIGRWVGYDVLKSSLRKKHIEKAEAMFQNYGVWAVAFGALAPIPYSAVCWTGGACGMKYKHFILASLLTRLPRFLFMGLLGSLL